MNRKILGILVMTLLIVTAIPTIAVNENNYNFSESRSFKPVDVPDSWLEGADQYQTDDYQYGYICAQNYQTAQAFKPTQVDLTAVALYFFNINAPSGVEITVAIRENLIGSDLTKTTINADSKKIEGKGKWVMFDFDDITVIPEMTYYIVCYANNDGVSLEGYFWFFDVGNKYDRGIGWASRDSGLTWVDLEEDPEGDPFLVEVDFCFITYYQEPPKNKVKNTFFITVIEELSNLFPLLNRLLKLFG